MTRSPCIVFCAALFFATPAMAIDCWVESCQYDTTVDSMGWINITHCVANDTPVSDWSEAINDAILCASSQTTHRVVYIPPGTYPTHKTVYVPAGAKNITIMGAGLGLASRIDYREKGGVALKIEGTKEAPVSGLTLRGFALIGAEGYWNTGLQAEYLVNTAVVRDVEVRGFATNIKMQNTWNVLLDRVASRRFGEVGIDLGPTTNAITLLHPYVRGLDQKATGIFIQGNQTQNVSGVHIIGGVIGHCGSSGIVVGGATHGIHIDGVYFEGNGHSAILAETKSCIGCDVPEATTVTGSTFIAGDPHTDRQIDMVDSASAVISNNHFHVVADTTGIWFGRNSGKAAVDNNHFAGSGAYLEYAKYEGITVNGVQTVGPGPLEVSAWKEGDTIRMEELNIVFRVIGGDLIQIR